MDIPAIVYAVVLVGALSFANFYGITESMRMNVAFTLIELAGLVIASPLFGAALAGLMIAMVLIIIGIQMISAGIGGRETRLTLPGLKKRSLGPPSEDIAKQ